MPVRYQRRLTVYAVGCLVTALLLFGFCFLDTAFAGRSVSEHDLFPYALADHVQYSLTGFRYFHQGHVLTGPHIGYPVVVAALLINLGFLWLARHWGARARQMFHVNAWAVVLTLGLGWPILLVAERVHNGLLSRGQIISVRATPLQVYVIRCQERLLEGRCTRTKTLFFPNPVAWGLLGLAWTGVAGWRSNRKASHFVVEAEVK